MISTPALATTMSTFAEPLHRFGEQPLDLLRLGDVCLQRDNADAVLLDLGHGGRRRVLISDVVHGDIRPKRGVSQGDGLADPPG